MYEAIFSKPSNSAGEKGAKLKNDCAAAEGLGGSYHRRFDNIFSNRAMQVKYNLL